MSPEEGTLAVSPLAGEPATNDVTSKNSAIAPQTAAADLEEHKALPRCANCGADVARKFCGRCGQRLEHEMHSVLHFTREVAEDLTHADSRLWSTIVALLFKPGFLTKEFIAGRRVRYLPPLRLYLVLSVVFFLVVGADHEQHKHVAIVQGSSGSAPLQVVPAGELPGMAAKPGESAEDREKRVCDPHYDGPASKFVTPFLRKGCRRYLKDHGQSSIEAFWHTLPRAMFFFLPALALVMKPMYWRPRHYYVEHLLFFLHNHAFAFLVFTLLTLVTRYAPSSVGDWSTFIVWLYLPYYLFVSMRRVYEQGRALTFAKLTVLSFAYLFGGAITLALTGVYSVYSG